MSQLNILKSYADGVTPTQYDLDNIIDGIETFFNVTNLGTDNIATAGITASTKFANNSLETTHFKADSITTAKLNTGACTEGKFDTEVITTAKLATDSIITAVLNDSSITTSKLGTDSITESKINSSAITNEKIADANITTAKISSTTLTQKKLSGIKTYSTASTGQAREYQQQITLSASSTQYFTNYGAFIRNPLFCLKDRASSTAYTNLTATTSIGYGYTVSGSLLASYLPGDNSFKDYFAITGGNPAALSTTISMYIPPGMVKFLSATTTAPTSSPSLTTGSNTLISSNADYYITEVP